MCIKWFNDKIKSFTCFDYFFVKLGVFAFTLMLAKLVPAILSLDWYCYGLVYVIIAVYFIFRLSKN